MCSCRKQQYTQDYSLMSTKWKLKEKSFECHFLIQMNRKSS
uniref:Uncharacterized protein n=1 Tax=Anguilla anguilla TaxID=7936 RepID=A0A0E9XBX5_ANGAN